MRDPVRIAVVQHQLRTHERMDLAALLSLTERAAEEGAQVLVYPCVPGIGASPALMNAFAANVAERTPGVTVISPCVALEAGPPLGVAPTPLGSTLILSGDACIDTGLFDEIVSLRPEALIWQMDSESDLQAEAVLELALDASLSLSGLVLVAATIGEARGLSSYGVSAIVHLGEILAEAGEEEDVVVADVPVPVPVPVTLPERRGQLPIPTPVLAQRLSVHRGEPAHLDHVSEGV